MDLVGRSFGQYQIVEPIGAGGMATVYKAYQASLERYVAIKVLPPQHALTPGFKERFIREARAVAQLSHPNILPIYDFGIQDDISYFVTKYVPDRTLSHLLGQPMDLSGVRQYVDQVAAALDHAHEQGIVHRDIKPSNMLLEDDWLLLADFGLAKIVAGSQMLTASGATLGTPAYVSPEQAEGKPVDHRSDIYSLGIVLYEMVTGRVPYKGETPAGVIIKHIIEPLPPPRSINPDLPETVERIILKATAKNPDHRYDRAGDLAKALSESQAVPPIIETATTKEPIGAPQPSALSMPRRATRWLSTGSGLALAGIGLLLLAIMGVILLSGDNHRAGTEGDANLPTRTPRPTVAAALPATATQPILSPTALPTAASRAPGVITTENLQDVAELVRLGKGTITALAVSPDGNTIAVAGSLGVWLYDTQALQPLALLEGHTKPVADVAWSPDGRHIASAGKDGTLRVWLVSLRDSSSEGLDSSDEIAREALVLRGHVGLVDSVAWSPDGTRLASGGWDDTVRIWSFSEQDSSSQSSTTAGEELFVLSGHTEAVLDTAWSPDGSQLASASRDSTVRIWSIPPAVAALEDSEALDDATPSEVGVLEGHTKAVTGVVWSPDGTRLASSSEDETLRVWLAPASEADLAAEANGERQLLVLQGHTSHVTALIWSPSGDQLASAALDRTVRVWDVTNGTEVRVLQGHTRPVRDVSWLPDGSGLVSGADDGALRVWDAANGRERHTLTDHVDTVLSVDWSPDGRHLASGNADGTLEIWSLSANEIEPSGIVTAATRLHRLTGHRSEIYSVAWSPKGQLVASADGVLDASVLLWNMTRPGEAQVADGHTSVVKSVAWSPDGSRLASASWDNTVRIWEATGRPLHVLAGHTDWVLSVTWSPSGGQLASGGKDGTVRIWTADGEPLGVLQGHGDQVTSVAWSPDGTRLASSSRDKTLRLWQITAEEEGGGRELLALNTPGAMTSLAWSPDGALLALASEFRDNLVRIWDAHTGRELGILEGHLDFVKAVAWSPDGAYLATAGADGTIRVWGLPEER